MNISHNLKYFSSALHKGITPTLYPLFYSYQGHDSEKLKGISGIIASDTSTLLRGKSGTTEMIHNSWFL